MCSRYAIVSSAERLEKRYNLASRAASAYTPNANLKIGEIGPVITMEKPNEITMMQFGMKSQGRDGKMRWHHFARAEGDNNREDDPNFKGHFGIWWKPSFAKPIRSQRCLIIADAFYEGSKETGYNEPYLVFARNKMRPISLGGIYSTWLDEKTNEETSGFAVLTTFPNRLLTMIQHNRCPVVVYHNFEKDWLSERTDQNFINTIMNPFNPDHFNAYRVDPKMKSGAYKGIDVLNPIGPKLLDESPVQEVVEAPKKRSYTDHELRKMYHSGYRGDKLSD